MSSTLANRVVPNVGAGHDRDQAIPEVRVRFSVQPPEVAPGAGTARPRAPAQSFIARRLVAYDPAGHLTCISTASSGWCGSADTTKVTFGIDAAGRHASQVFGLATTTYAYLGTSSQITSTTSGSTTTYSAIDAIGDRLAQGSPSAAAGYLIADLHGNVVAAVEPDSSPAYLNAFRYDAYGETCGSWHASAGSLTVPWRFQGRMLESSSASPATDLYDFGARSYDPSLGAFTSFDSVSGSAQNPLTLNRYLYANANPATLVDPTGHYSVDQSGQYKYLADCPECFWSDWDSGRSAEVLQVKRKPGREAAATRAPQDRPRPRAPHPGLAPIRLDGAATPIPTRR